jgi:hypothetical protein
MRRFPRHPKFRNFVFWCGSLAALVGLGVFLVSCGSGTGSAGGGSGQITVNLSDPPSCASPNGPFTHVYVTIRSVQANTSATADDNSAGWQELAPQLNTSPKQIDLFSLAGNACLLVTLGSNNALPAGSYQQIRLLLVPNSGSNGPFPNNNQCSGGYNCVVLSDGSIHELQLSSEANTGLKIPPGQVVGGPITVASGQDVDLNIDFNACSSIVAQGNGQYRLKPALTAGQVSTNNTGISGKVVDSVTRAAINVGTTGSVLVALEQPDATGTDVIFRETIADSSGSFNFCPLPANAAFDVVAVAIDANGAAYDATIAANVPGGTNLGTIPINLETSSPNTPTVFTGTVTAMGGSGSIDARVSALQTVALPGIGNRAVAIPGETDVVLNAVSTPNISVSPSEQYTLVEPASNPSFGVFNPQGISYSTPVAGTVPYAVRAQAFVPLSGGTASCSPPSQTVNATATNAPLLALPGANVAVKEIDFGGCS